MLRKILIIGGGLMGGLLGLHYNMVPQDPILSIAYGLLLGATLGSMLFIFSIIGTSSNRYNTKKIKVIRRSDDFLASTENQTGIWGSGKSTYEAIGDLVTHHEEFFGIKIEIDSK